MWLTESWLGRLLTAFVDYLLLNLAWLVCCVPVVTAPAATAALYDVLRLRQRGDEPAIVSTFVRSLREHFWRAEALGAGGAVVAAVLAADAAVANRMGGTAGVVLAVLVYAALAVFALAALALHPVLVSFDASLRQVVKTALLVPLLYPVRSLAGLALAVTAGLLVVTLPVTAVLAVTVTADLVLRLHRGMFQRVVRRVADAGPGGARVVGAAGEAGSDRGSVATREGTRCDSGTAPQR